MAGPKKEQTTDKLGDSMPELAEFSANLSIDHNVSINQNSNSMLGLSLDGSTMLDNEDFESMNLQTRAAKDTRESLARTETQAVSCLRYVVLLILLATAVGVSVATFIYSRRVEENSFKAEFQSVAVVTLRSFVESVEHKLGAQDAIASAITSHAEDAQEVFPNVTIPHFDVKGATLRTQTDSLFSFYLPLVTDETRAGYEAYTKVMQAQVFEGYMREEGLRQYQDAYFGIPDDETQAAEGAAEEASTAEEDAIQVDNGARRLHIAGPDVHPVIHDGIWGRTLTNDSLIEAPGKGPYLPVWQVSPVIPVPATINFNFLAFTDLAPMMNHMLDTGKATLSYLQTTHEGADTEDLIRLCLTLNQYRHSDVDYNADPLTQMAYPVFDSFDPTTKKVSAMLVTTIFWRLLFANILPDNVQGVICVLSNSLGETVTYRLDGRTATYIGTGDHHDPKYDALVVTRDIFDYITERASIETSSYTTVELDGGYTSYRIHVYPSDDMEASYITSDPVLYAVVVAFIFAFTSMVFLMYDRLVEFRQKKVMDKAVKSTAVVTSLFPEAVHDRLFAETSEAVREKSKELVADSWKAPPESATRSLQRQPTLADVLGATNGRRSSVSHLNNPKMGKPIADKFEAVTVLFADLAGFTSWSSTREPEDVFVLLETLYGAFDRVSLKRDVFKVETIGDCYMCATGLPIAQPDHAVRMVKFARECMHRMGRLLKGLAPRLGSDTKELAMRVGMHSGAVTAGVLRGDKGRFQLFGDTVNTASRMESNGMKGRIHCSSETAKLLPDRWLTVREDKIVAKGKGEMVTYFIDGHVGSKSSVGNSVAFTDGGCTTDEDDDESETNMDKSNWTYSLSIGGSIHDETESSTKISSQQENGVPAHSPRPRQVQTPTQSYTVHRCLSGSFDWEIDV